MNIHSAESQTAQLLSILNFLNFEATEIVITPNWGRFQSAIQIMAR